MKKSAIDILLFGLSLTALIVSVVLMVHYGAYEISLMDGALVIDGGWFLIGMNLLRLVALLFLTILSGIRLFGSKK